MRRRFEPHLFGVTSKSIYLVDPAGKVVLYPLPIASEGRLIDSFPQLLNDPERLREIVRGSGYFGAIEIKLTVDRQGCPRNVQLPVELAGIPEVVEAVNEWRLNQPSNPGRRSPSHSISPYGDQ